METRINDKYILRTKWASNTYVVNSIELEWKLVNGGYVSHVDLLERGGDLKLQSAIVFQHVGGKILSDFMDTGWGILYLISDRLKQILEEHKLTGWKCFPVEILDKKGYRIDKVYHGFSITGRCGPIDFGKSEVIEKRLVPNGSLSTYFRGMYPGLGTWDGSDFFLPREYGGTIVAARARDILLRHKVTNIRFENLATMEIGTNTVLDR